MSDSHALKSFLKGPSFRSFAASVSARNLLNPVVAAPRPSAAALVSTSSREAITPTEAGLATAAVAGAIAAVGATWTTGVAVMEGCVIPDPRLLKSSSILCWSAFLRPCTSHIHVKKSKENYPKLRADSQISTWETLPSTRMKRYLSSFSQWTKWSLIANTEPGYPIYHSFFIIGFTRVILGLLPRPLGVCELPAL